LTKKEIQLRKLQKRIAETSGVFKLIDENDNILAAISGGIDSLVMLHSLADMKKRAPFHFRIEAVHVSVEQISREVDKSSIETLCRQLEIPFHAISTRIDDEGHQQKGICFLCSWYRRKALFQYANAQHITKIAFGHHLDDVLETLLMNMTNHGRLSTIPPKVQMRKGSYALIRPLTMLTKQEVMLYAETAGLTSFEKPCPFENTNKRSGFGQILAQLAAMNPKAKRNLFQSMRHINREYLPPEEPFSSSKDDLY
jgi:tRNA(Ile)-lysidine synthetase-like protein